MLDDSPVSAQAQALLLEPDETWASKLVLRVRQAPNGSILYAESARTAFPFAAPLPCAPQDGSPLAALSPCELVSPDVWSPDEWSPVASSPVLLPCAPSHGGWSLAASSLAASPDEIPSAQSLHGSFPAVRSSCGSLPVVPPSRLDRRAVTASISRLTRATSLRQRLKCSDATLCRDRRTRSAASYARRSEASMLSKSGVIVWGRAARSSRRSPSARTIR